MLHILGNMLIRFLAKIDTILISVHLSYNHLSLALNKEDSTQIKMLYPVRLIPTNTKVYEICTGLQEVTAPGPELSVVLHIKQMRYNVSELRCF